MKIIRLIAAAGVLPACTLAVFAWLALQQIAFADYYPGPLQPGQVLGNNGSSPAPAAPISMFGAVAAPGGAQLYAAPTAQGSGNCLSAANACTLPTACAFRSQVTTFISGSFNINLASGTYNTTNADSALCSIHGNAGGSSSALTSLIGNVVSGSCISQTAVILAVPNNSTAILIKDGGEAVLNCVEITLGNNAIGIQNAGQSAVADYDNVTWGSAGSNSVDVSGSYGAYINLTSAGETIIGNRSFHWLLSGNAVLNAGGLTTLTGTPSFAGAFLSASGNNFIFLATWTFSGSATGTRATLNGPGYMVTAGAVACSSAFPGGGGCAFSNGFQDNAGEGAVLPNPSPSTLGGIESYAAVSHQWINQISTSGAPSSTQPATSDLSDVTAPTSWTATDGSGASLSLTTSDTRYAKYGKVCVVSFYIAYPSTADTHNAQINGIPAACAAYNGAIGYIAGGAAFGSIASVSSSIAWVSLQTNGQSLFIFGNGSILTNAQMSNGSIRGTITYITN